MADYDRPVCIRCDERMDAVSARAALVPPRSHAARTTPPAEVDGLAEIFADLRRAYTSLPAPALLPRPLCLETR